MIGIRWHLATEAGLELSPTTINPSDGNLRRPARPPGRSPPPLPGPAVDQIPFLITLDYFLSLFDKSAQLVVWRSDRSARGLPHPSSRRFCASPHRRHVVSAMAHLIPSGRGHPGADCGGIFPKLQSERAKNLPPGRFPRDPRHPQLPIPVAARSVTASSAASCWVGFDEAFRPRLAEASAGLRLH